MKTQNYKLSIASPCHEDWAKMSPEKNGRFCSSCSKIVVDFSCMSAEAISGYLQNSTGKVCGQFRRSQLENTYTFNYESPYSFNRTFLKLSLAGLLTLAGVNGYSQNLQGQNNSCQTDNSGKKTGCDLLVKGDVKKQPSLALIQLRVNDKVSGKPIHGAKAEIGLLNKSYPADKSGVIKILVPDSLRNKKTDVYIYANGYETLHKAIDVNSQAGRPLVLALEKEELMIKGEIEFIPEDPKKKNCIKKD